MTIRLAVLRSAAGIVAGSPRGDRKKPFTPVGGVRTPVESSGARREPGAFALVPQKIPLHPPNSDAQ